MWSTKREIDTNNGGLNQCAHPRECERRLILIARLPVRHHGIHAQLAWLFLPCHQ